MTAHLDWTDREAAGEHLAAVAWKLAGEIRMDNPAAVDRWLAQQIPADEWLAFAKILAAHIPDDVPQTELLAWTLHADLVGAA